VAKSAQLEYALCSDISGIFILHLNLLPHNAGEFEKALESLWKTMDLAN